MSFTDEEKRIWHEQKRLREDRPLPVRRPVPFATCVHCHRPFGVTEGVVTDEAALCDICLGD